MHSPPLRFWLPILSPDTWDWRFSTCLLVKHCQVVGFLSNHYSLLQSPSDGQLDWRSLLRYHFTIWNQSHRLLSNMYTETQTCSYQIHMLPNHSSCWYSKPPLSWDRPGLPHATPLPQQPGLSPAPDHCAVPAPPQGHAARGTPGKHWWSGDLSPCGWPRMRNPLVRNQDLIKTSINIRKILCEHINMLISHVCSDSF